MPLTQVTEHNFESEVLREKLPVLVEFGATWCGPCKTVEPELEALSHELSGKAKIVKIDIDQSPILARELGIQSVPTFVVFAQGKPAGARVGALRRGELRELLEPAMPRQAGALRPKEVIELIKKGHVRLVDTRESAVYNRVHLPGAVSLPLDEVSTRLTELQSLDGSPVIYCRSGQDSAKLAAELATQGVPVAFLEGGVLAWEAEGYDVERS